MSECPQEQIRDKLHKSITLLNLSKNELLSGNLVKCYKNYMSAEIVLNDIGFIFDSELPDVVKLCTN